MSLHIEKFLELGFRCRRPSWRYENIEWFLVKMDSETEDKLKELTKEVRDGWAITNKITHTREVGDYVKVGVMKKSHNELFHGEEAKENDEYTTFFQMGVMLEQDDAEADDWEVSLGIKSYDIAHNCVGSKAIMPAKCNQWMKLSEIQENK